MKVILKHAVPALGSAGDIVDVKDGYGNNYLVPRGLAMLATKGAVADAAAIRAARVKRDVRTLDDAKSLQAKLEAAPVRVVAKAGKDGDLYGSVGNTVIAAAVKAQLGITLDRRKIPLERPLKTLGAHSIPVQIHPELTATLSVEVVGGE